jgi:hypothetical protein
MQWSKIEPILRRTYGLMEENGGTSGSAVLEDMGLDESLRQTQDGSQRGEGGHERPRSRAERFEAESLVEGCGVMVDCVDDHGARYGYRIADTRPAVIRAKDRRRSAHGWGCSRA